MIHGLFLSVDLSLVTNPMWYVVVPSSCDMRLFLLLPWILSGTGDRTRFWAQLQRRMGQERRLILSRSTHTARPIKIAKTWQDIICWASLPIHYWRIQRFGRAFCKDLEKCNITHLFKLFTAVFVNFVFLLQKSTNQHRGKNDVVPVSFDVLLIFH